MENRFGIKDLFLFLLIGAVLVVIVLAMTQYDRQYKLILDLKNDNKSLANDLNNLKGDLRSVYTTLDEIRSQPLAVFPATQSTAGGPATRPSSSTRVDAFTRIKEAEKMPGFARGDWLVDNFGTKIGKLTPVVQADVYQRWVEYQVFDRLCDSDPTTLEAIPRLATRWEISADSLRMKFYLRRGVEFSDGVRFTADDVIFTIKWIQNPKVDGESTRVYLNKLKDVVKIDDYTVEFIFNEYYYLNFDTVAGLSILPKHFYEQYTPEQFNDKTGLVLGSGPYRLESPDRWTPGQPVILVRNERFWGTKPTFDRIVFREVQGEATQLVMYGNQEHDIIRCTPEQFLKIKSDDRVMGFSSTHEFYDVYGGYRYIAWNQMKTGDDQKKTPTFFADKRVRQAMTMLIDRDRIIKDIYLGYGKTASGPFSPSGPQSAPDVKPWPFDIAKAKALLKEAGFEDRNGDGLIESADGTPFKFKLTFPSGAETYQKVAFRLKDSFKAAGIEMEPDRQDWPVLMQKYNGGTYDACALGFSSSPESDPYQVFHSSQIQNQGDNRSYYINLELDKLIEKARVEPDRPTRLKMWHQVHRILHEDQPYTFLSHRQDLWAINGRIQNIKPDTIGLNFVNMNPAMIPWFVPKSRQKYSAE